MKIIKYTGIPWPRALFALSHAHNQYERYGRLVRTHTLTDSVRI